MQKSTDIFNIFYGTHKRSRNKIYVVIDSKNNIAFIFFTHVRHIQMKSRNINAFMIFQFTVTDNHAVNLCLVNRLNNHFHQPIIHQNAGSRLYVFRKLFVCDICLCLIPQYFICYKRKLLSLFQIDFTIFEITKSNFRTFGI